MGEGLIEEVRRLGAEFRRRGMKEHLRPLRVYFLAVKHGLTRGKLEVSWSAEQTRMWLEALRLPPYEHALPLRPWRSSCATCGQGKPNSYEATLAALRRIEFPGGARAECLTCKAVWIEEEPRQG